MRVLDEAGPIAWWVYQNDRTQHRAETIAAHDGDVVVIAGCNHSVPWPLKYAIGRLYGGWANESAGLVEHYVDRGARAVEEIRSIFAELGLADVREQVVLSTSADFDHVGSGNARPAATDAFSPGIRHVDDTSGSPNFNRCVGGTCRRGLCFDFSMNDAPVSERNIDSSLTAILSGALPLTLVLSSLRMATASFVAESRIAGHAETWVVQGHLLMLTTHVPVSSVPGEDGMDYIGVVARSAGSAAVVLAPIWQLLIVGSIMGGARVTAVILVGVALFAATLEGVDHNRRYVAFGAATVTGLAVVIRASGGLVEALGWRGAVVIFAAGGLVLIISYFLLARLTFYESLRLVWSWRCLAQSWSSSSPYEPAAWVFRDRAPIFPSST